MPQEPLFQYTHVGAGLVENVVLRPTEDTETYPSGWKYTLHLGTLDDLTLVRYDNSHEDTKGTSTTPRLCRVRTEINILDCSLYYYWY